MKEKRGRERSPLFHRTDLNIWVILIFLCFFGAVMIYSASAYECSVNQDFADESNPSMHFLKRQLIFIAVGMIGAFFVQYINYNILERLGVLIYAFTTLMIFLLKTSLAVEVNGAKRWLVIAGVQFQVAEFVKVGVIIMLAITVRWLKGVLKEVPLTFLLWAVGGIPALLLLGISKDLSSSIVVLGITFMTSLMATRTYKLHAAVFAAVLLAAGGYVFYISQNMPTAEEIQEASYPFRKARIAAWLDPERYADSKAYQPLQALYAIGSGGFFGKGLGNSVQKLGTIPEAQNDMIFSILCEELGVFGAVIFVGMLVYLLYQIYRVARKAENLYGAFLCMGVIWHIGIQAIINIAVNCGVFPNTGLPMPFLSYGGTSIVCLILEIGMTLSVERYHMGAAIERRKRERRRAQRGGEAWEG